MEGLLGLSRINEEIATKKAGHSAHPNRQSREVEYRVGYGSDTDRSGVWVGPTDNNSAIWVLNSRVNNDRHGILEARRDQMLVLLTQGSRLFFDHATLAIGQESQDAFPGVLTYYFMATNPTRSRLGIQVVRQVLSGISMPPGISLTQSELLRVIGILNNSAPTTI